MAQPRPTERSGTARVLSLFRTAARAVPEPVSPARKIGRYAIYAEIAAGGLATVHLGRLLGPVGFARTVAIKRLHPPFAKDPEFVASFLDEARLAARVRHPNVVPTLDVVATGGELFVIMEFVVGESLVHLMRLAAARKRRVPVPVSVAIMAGVLHGLHAAHEARDAHGEALGIVHRDVSPHNVLVGIDGAAHLIDFGIAKARGRSQVTRDGQIKGKVSYMPPEQVLGGSIDRRADIFAASIVLWEMLTGRRLFHGVDDGDVVARVLHAPIDPPSAHAPELSQAMDSLVLRGLARDRTGRYSTAREMALALEAAVTLAPPSRVGTWVESLAHDALAERAAHVAAVEQDASSRSMHAPPESALTVVSSRMAIVSTPSGWGESPSLGSTRASRRVRLPFAAPVAAAVVAIALLAAIGWHERHARQAGPSHVPPAMPAIPEGRPIEPTSLAPAPPAAPFAASSSAASPSTPGATAAPEPRPVRNHRSSPQTPPPAAHPGASVRPAPSIAPKAVSCDPPFWYDADGNKRYYRQCVGL